MDSPDIKTREELRIPDHTSWIERQRVSSHQHRQKTAKIRQEFLASTTTRRARSCAQHVKILRQQQQQQQQLGTSVTTHQEGNNRSSRYGVQMGSNCEPNNKSSSAVLASSSLPSFGSVNHNAPDIRSVSHNATNNATTDDTNHQRHSSRFEKIDRPRNFDHNDTTATTDDTSHSNYHQQRVSRFDKIDRPRYFETVSVPPLPRLPAPSPHPPTFQTSVFQGMGGSRRYLVCPEWSSERLTVHRMVRQGRAGELLYGWM